MQTFLPYSSFAKSAKVLDRLRLGKQRVEAKQIVLAHENVNYGWQNHPATRMWRGYTRALCHYGTEICLEWRRRGYRDSLLEFFMARSIDIEIIAMPTWLGDEEFHLSHRSNLLAKDYDYYKQFWTCNPFLRYKWPI